MNKLFYPKLALSNIGKNRRFYFPYIMTIIGTIAMFYVMCSITFNEGIKDMPRAGSVQTIMAFGCIVIGLFAVIFLFYTNSFLMKRRKNELGLYNILGMEKKHIAKMLVFELIFIAIIGLVVGIGIGVLFSKLCFMLLYKLMGFAVIQLTFELCGRAIITSVILFAAIFVVTLISNLARISLASPIQLLHGGNVGEKEPKTRVIMTILGILFMGAGYFMALTIESPLQALTYFFVAVICVIIGTYMLFVAVSISILKLMRKSKKYYYNKKHFTSVSGMLYRMKQNGVGLANICILSTMVLVMISTTVSMYIGVDDELSARYPTDVSISAKQGDYVTDMKDIAGKVQNLADENDIKLLNLYHYDSISLCFGYKDGKFTTDEGNVATYGDIHAFEFVTAETYEEMLGKPLTLGENEVAVYSAEDMGDTLDILGKQYTIKQKLSSFPNICKYMSAFVHIHYVVVNSDEEFKYIYDSEIAAYGNDGSPIKGYVTFDLEGTDDEKLEFYKKVKEQIVVPVVETATEEDGSVTTTKNSVLTSESKQDTREEFYAAYGGFLFLGLFLGVLFMMATVLIIYYKQVSEGYEDRERFQVMKKVGMSGGEVKQSIRSQVLTVFFLPIIVAALHVCGAFKMISKLLMLMNLSNIGLFMLCTLATALAFAVVYGIVYLLTSRVYYRIINNK